MKNIKGVLVSNKNGLHYASKYVLKYEDYNDLYPILDCDLFEIPERKIGRTWYSIYCDEEGLFKGFRVPSIITYRDGQLVEYIVGNVFICKHTPSGEIKSLTDKQVLEILRHIVFSEDANVAIRATV